MKRSLALVVVLSVVVLGTIADTSAFGAPKMRANIPFSFYVGTNALPAGDYAFEMLGLSNGCAAGPTVVIRSQDGSISQFLPVATAGSNGRAVAYQLVFQRHGDTYFLNKVHQGSYEVSLAKSRMQKELSVAYSGGSRAASSEAVAIASTPE